MVESIYEYGGQGPGLVTVDTKERDSYRQPWLAMVTSNHGWLFFEAIMVSNGKFRQLTNPIFFSVLTSAIGNSCPAFC